MEKVISKSSLHFLSELYKHFEKRLDYSFELNANTYKDKGYESKEIKKHVEYVNVNCMQNIRQSEFVLNLIKSELHYRNIDKRFGIAV